MEHRTHLNWIVGLIIIVLILCLTLIGLNYNAWTLRFEMDNNTLEAVRSINWSSIK